MCTYNDSLTHQCNCAMNGEDISLAGLSESKSIRFCDNTRNERTTLCCQDTLRTVVELQVVHTDLIFVDFQARKTCCCRSSMPTGSGHRRTHASRYVHKKNYSNDRCVAICTANIT